MLHVYINCTSKYCLRVMGPVIYLSISIQKNFFPTDTDRVRRAEIKGGKKSLVSLVCHTISLTLKSESIKH